VVVEARRSEHQDLLSTRGGQFSSRMFDPLRRRDVSFDLYLQRFKSGGSAEVSRAEVLAVLRRHSQVAADRFGFYLVDFPDGSSVEFSAKGLEDEESFTGCAVLVQGFSQSIVDFVFDVAKTGDMVILNA